MVVSEMPRYKSTFSLREVSSSTQANFQMVGYFSDGWSEVG
jgi:hypothetical protein